MPDVSITIADRQFKLTCGEGEEQQLQNLGRLVDETARNAGYNSQALTESRMLLFTSLLLADQLDELQKQKGGAGNAQASPATSQSSAAAEAVEKLAQRMEKLASSLEETVSAP